MRGVKWNGRGVWLQSGCGEQRVCCVICCLRSCGETYVHTWALLYEACLYILPNLGGRLSGSESSQVHHHALVVAPGVAVARVEALLSAGSANLYHTQ